MASQMETSDELKVKREENEDIVLSMVEVLQESEELEEEATAVLGDSDDRCCTYPLGYRERQALYACVACTTADSEPAGICLACSYECHEGHQLYELYTKRNFRCDCGNSKFGSLKCKLILNKAAANPDNKYNQNFHGMYCICSRPYPDPEDEIEDEMIQCVVCEDWFHGRHLGGISVPDSNDYQEMVCSQCMEGSCDFLWYYYITSKEVKLETEDSSAAVDVETVLKTQLEPEEQKDIPELSDTKPTEVCVDEVNETPQNSIQPENTDNTISSATITPDIEPSDNKQLPSSETSHQGGGEECIPTIHGDGDGAGTSTSSSVDLKPHLNGQSDGDDKILNKLCKLDELKLREIERKGHSTFWPSGWRRKLCTCEECKKLYERKHISFLLDEFDTVSAYEERGKIKHAGSSQYQMGMDALTSLNRVQQVEVLHEYNDLKTSLSDYLQSFANEGKVVKEKTLTTSFQACNLERDNVLETWAFSTSADDQLDTYIRASL